MLLPTGFGRLDVGSLGSRRERALEGLGIALMVVIGAVGTACSGGPGPAGTDDRRPPDVPDLPDIPDGSDDPDPPVACEPGRSTLRRLNRTEYNHTVRDLLGDESRPAETFPADDTGFGFDTTAATLALSPLLFDTMEAAAEDLARRVMIPRIVEPSVVRVEAEDAWAEGGFVADGHRVLPPEASLTFTFDVPAPASYELRARLSARFASESGAVPELEVEVGGEVVHRTEVGATARDPATLGLPVDLSPQASRVVLRHVSPPGDSEERELRVDWVELHGPNTSLVLYEPGREALVACDPAVDGRRACSAEVLGSFARVAWRRPVKDHEVEGLVALTDIVEEEGDPFDVGLAVGFQAILLSPHFVFRVERGVPGDPERLTDHELAVRLSYFLWRTTPDAELSRLADEGRLDDPDVMIGQVERLLADPRSEAFIEDFVGQWLHTRALSEVAPSPRVFHDWDNELSAAMAEETPLFFGEFLRSGRDARELLKADFTYLNDRLARHYGLPEPGTSELVRLAVDPEQRGGVLFHGSVLTVTSPPRRTSPVRRGSLILEALLCAPPDPPPPNVEAFPEPVDPDGSLRDRFEQHRSSPSCMGCHAVIDPLGFALEHYDGIGAWRDSDDGFPIDPSGVLPPDDQAFSTAGELMTLLQDHERLPACLVEKLAVFALGRGPTEADACAFERIEQEFVDGGYALPVLIESLVTSASFTRRSVEEGP